MSQVDRPFLDPVGEAQVLHCLDDLLASLIAILPDESPAVLVDRAIRLQDVDHRQVVAETACVVVGIVGWGHLDGPGAHLLLGQQRVGNDRNLPVDQGNPDGPAHKVGVAFIGRVHTDGRITEHRFGPGRRERDRLVRADHRIAKRPESSGNLFVEHLVVGHRRLEKRIPVDEPLAAVDQSIGEQLEEGPANGPGTHLVESEASPSPVAAGTDQFQL